MRTNATPMPRAEQQGEGLQVRVAARTGYSRATAPLVVLGRPRKLGTSEHDLIGMAQLIVPEHLSVRKVAACPRVKCQENHICDPGLAFLRFHRTSLHFCVSVAVAHPPTRITRRVDVGNAHQIAGRSARLHPTVIRYRGVAVSNPVTLIFFSFPHSDGTQSPKGCGPTPELEPVPHHPLPPPSPSDSVIYLQLHRG